MGAFGDYSLILYLKVLVAASTNELIASTGCHWSRTHSLPHRLLHSRLPVRERGNVTASRRRGDYINDQPSRANLVSVSPVILASRTQRLQQRCPRHTLVHEEGGNEESLEPVWRYQPRRNRLSARAPNSEQWKAGEISKVAWTVAWLAGVVRLVLSVCVCLCWQPVWRKCSTSAVSRWPLALC